MNELTSYCSESLLERLAGSAVSESNVVSLAEQRIAREVKALPALNSRVVRWRFGIDAEQLSVKEIAARLRMHADDVQQILDEALMQLGFSLLSAEAAA